MREIKFRAWDAEFNRWAKPCDISIQGDGTAWIDRRHSDYGDIIDTIDGTEENAIIEQFTGLKDKNGKEIYEGDIVKWYVNNVERKGCVEYLSDYCGYDLKQLDGWHVCIDWARGEVEVIANIHENPELLA